MVGMGAPQAAKRAFVRVIVYLASVYGISTNVNRDSPVHGAANNKLEF